LIGGGAFFLFVLAVFALVYLTLHAGGTDAGITGFGDRIGVVDLDGVILSPQPVVGQLKKFGDDSSIKAIIIHVNSPGGGRGRVGGDLSRGQAHSQREEEENRGID
jgi:protease IV